MTGSAPEFWTLGSLDQEKNKEGDMVMNTQNENLGPVKLSAEAEVMSITEARLVDTLVEQKASSFFKIVFILSHI